MSIGSVQSTSDRQLVEAARKGDQQAFAQLYSRYFDPVYDFVARMTRNRDEAADIAQDTFLKAMNALGGLKEGASFKSWIFTIARNTALNRLERASRTRPLTFEDDDGEEVGMEVVETDRFADPEQAAEAGAVANLVWEAAAGLDPKQYSLLDLHLRQGLESAEIAEVVGVTKNNAYVMLNRLKKAVEESIGAYIMLHNGRRYCDALDAALEDAGVAEMTPDVRRMVQRHVAQCESCESRRKQMVSPLAVFGALAPVGAPPALKADVLGQLMSQWPGAAAPASSGGAVNGMAGRGGLFGGRAFQAMVGLGAFAAVLIGLLLVPGSPIALFRGDDGGQQAVLPIDDINSPTPTPDEPTPTPRPTEPGDTPEPSPTPEEPTPPPADTPTSEDGQGGGAIVANTPTTTPSSTATNTATNTATSTATDTPTPVTPTPTNTPCLPFLDTNVSEVNMFTGAGGSFIVQNLSLCVEAPVVLSTDAPWLSIEPRELTIPTFGSASINLRADRSLLPPGPALAIVFITPSSGAPISITVRIDGPTPTPETPTVPPDADPPVISNVACTVTGRGITTVTATITDASGIQSAQVVAPDGSATMSNVGGTTWSGTLPFRPNTFDVRAVDTESNQATHGPHSLGLCTPG